MRYKTMMGIDPNNTAKATSHLRPGSLPAAPTTATSSANNTQHATAMIRPGSSSAAHPSASNTMGGASSGGGAGLGTVSVGEGYQWRGAHFTDGNLRSYVNDRYYNERVLFHTGAGNRPGSARAPSASIKSPRVPQSTSCRCPGQQPRRLKFQ
eukprot:TRINITY_DN48996_c0_g1_i1.p1 TRINITY_DN48996_c0_g1~~TRINITY_DN48996_c0_g1_i1.p1  ORF type:complete len:153 (+),score=24.66 TRINITY_DN48996_c0_g1_i1:218-676(+)